jgi:hypothetical protein
MNEQDSTAIVKPSQEAFMLFDREDDSVIANRLRGAVLKEYVYAFKQQGQMIYGLGVDGAEACKRELAKIGEVIREDGITIMYQDPDRAFFQALASRWSVVRGQAEMKLDTTVELKNQAKFITRRDGTQEPNSFWLEQGGSKAMRNAVLNLIPEWIKQQVIAMYKAEAKVVEMTPPVADALTQEAHAAFKDKDERDGLVEKLKQRWIDLELGQSQVKAILKKKGLSESLASRTADWSTVDIAVIQDLVKEAGA